MRKSVGLILIALLMGGCASTPKISQLNQDVRKVALIRNGTAPLAYSTGVVDTSSFWAAYGGGVSNQLGGGALWRELETSGNSTVTAEATRRAAMVQKLYGNHDLAPKVTSALLPQLAMVWGVPYDEHSVVTLESKPAYVDLESGLLQGIDTEADLILMAEISKLNLTERFSVGGAFKAGLTMGTNRKSLTVEVRVTLRAFKRTPSGTGYTEVWSAQCGPDYTTMKTSYYLDELAKSGQKMTEILDEAKMQSIDRCTKALDAVAEGETSGRNG